MHALYNVLLFFIDRKKIVHRMGRLQLLVFLIVSMAATDVQSRDHHCHRLLQEDGLMDDVTSGKSNGSIRNIYIVIISI